MSSPLLVVVLVDDVVLVLTFPLGVVPSIRTDR